MIPINESVKTDLRITHSAMDMDINTAILAAKQKLKMQGVDRIDDSDPLTEQAIKMYCRGWFNYQGDGSRYESAFRKLADAMALSGDYTEAPE